MRLPMNTSLATLKPSGIRRINALAAQHPGCIALALGEPDFPTPDVISAEVTASLDRGDTHYPPNNGRPALREALSAYMGDAGLTFSADEVILTDGATEALSATFMAMLNPGDQGHRHLYAQQSYGLHPQCGIARRRGTRGRAGGHLRGLRRRI